MLRLCAAFGAAFKEVTMGHSIYLADDEKSIRELLHSFLASDGYTVRSFENGDALLEAFRQEPAELVILDIMMPGTDGLAVCRELRSVSDIPIILLTAKDSELDYVMGISQGSDDYLTKPFRPTILLMKVRALLRRVEMDRGKIAAAVDELRYGDIRYSATENAVLCGNTPVALTQTELRLLSYMMTIGTTGRRNISSRPALCFLSWRTATSPTHGARTPIGWRKSCWRIAVNGLLRPIDATTSRQTSTT